MKTTQTFTIETSAAKSARTILSSNPQIGETKRLSLFGNQVLDRGAASTRGLVVAGGRDSAGNAFVVAGAASANPLHPGAPPITYGFMINANQAGDSFTLSGAFGGFPSITITATNEAGETVTVYDYDEKNSPAGAFSLIPGIGDQSVNQVCTLGKDGNCQPGPM
jgi:hypothetical protein